MGLVGMGKKSKKSVKESDSGTRIEYFAMIELSCGCKDINLRTGKDGYSCKNCSRMITQSLITDLYETPDDLVGCLASSMIQGSANPFGSRKKYKVVSRCSDSDPMEELRSLKTVEGERYSLEEERDALRKKVEDRDSEIAGLNAMIEGLRKDNRELSENLQKSQAHSEGLQNTLQKLQGDRTELQTRMAELQSRIDGLQERNVELQSINSTLSNRLNSRERDLDATLRRRSAELKAKDSVQVRAVVSDFLDYIGYVNNMIEGGHSFERDYYDALSQQLRNRMSVHGVELLWHGRREGLGDEQLYEPSFVPTGERSLDMCVHRVDGIGCRFKDGAYEDIPERLSIYRYDPEADASAVAVGVEETADADAHGGSGSGDSGSGEQIGSEETGLASQNDVPLPDVIELPGPGQTPEGDEEGESQNMQQSAEVRYEEAGSEEGEIAIDDVSVPEPASDSELNEPASAKQDDGPLPEEREDAAPLDESHIADVTHVESEEAASDGQSGGIRNPEPAVDIDIPEPLAIPVPSVSEYREGDASSAEEVSAASQAGPNATALESVEQGGPVADAQSDGIYESEPTVDNDVPESPPMPEASMPGRDECGAPAHEGEHTVSLGELESIVVESALQEETMADDQSGEIRDSESLADVTQESLPQEGQENGKLSAVGDDSVTKDELEAD